MKNQDQIELIEQYIANQLSEEDRGRVETLIQQDPELAQEYERRTLAHDLIDFAIAEDLRAELRDMDLRETKVVSLTRRRRMYTLAIAASVVLLIGAFFFILPTAGPGAGELALSYYEVPAGTFRGDDAETELPSTLMQGLEAFDAGDYAGAAGLLERVEAGYEAQRDYFLGHSYFQLQRYQEAEQKFNDVVSSSDLRYLEDAEWYRLLSCLAQNSDCQDLFQGLLEENHPYYPQAEAINKKLK